jgi:hypothetical protein
LGNSHRPVSFGHLAVRPASSLQCHATVALSF